jgi:hypothetical protein
MTRPVGSAISFGNTVGTICHDNPYLSLSHPHLKSDPPADGFSHNIPISFRSPSKGNGTVLLG